MEQHPEAEATDDKIQPRFSAVFPGEGLRTIPMVDLFLTRDTGETR